jgi:branched-chain amino acid transport system ATP-binding protein
MAPILETKNLEVSYGPVNVTKGISIGIEEGKIVTILGANGSGKTTILRTISGLIVPDKGTVTYKGKPIQGMEPEEIVKMGISQVPEGREIFQDLSVYKNILMGGFTRKDKKEVEKDMDRMYSYFPLLKERCNQYADTLSGGEQQMLVIARALMSRPSMLLLDEPSLGLAPAFVKKIFGIIKQINEEEKTTILLVEQNAKMALELASHGFILEVGRIVMDDATDILRKNPDVQEFYLGVREEGIRGTRRWKKKKVWR